MWGKKRCAGLLALALTAGAWDARLTAEEPKTAETGPRPNLPNIHLYDLGTDASPLWAGFTRITPETVYENARGYGWVAPNPAPRATVAEFLDSLAIDSIQSPSDLTLTFRQDVPNGEYEVWVLTGSHASIFYLLRPHALLLQGKEVLSIQPTEEEAFRAVKYEWSKGDDLYDHFVVPRFAWLRARAEVSDGALEIGFTHSYSFPVCAIVIAENSVAGRVEKEIRQIELRRKQAFHDIWNEVETPAGTLEPISPEEQRRGFIVSAVDCGEDVLPRSGPPAGASRSEILMFGTPGEQAQASFGVYGLTDLRHVSFDVTELRSADRQVIPASAMERGLVQFTPRRIGEEAKYDISATLILPARPTFVGKDTCKQFWLTVRVPDNAAAGVYEGTVQISSLDAAPASLKLRFRVLPFKLMTPPVERYFYFGSMIYHAYDLLPQFDEKRYWESVRAEARYLKDNEFCLAQCLINRLSSRVTMKDGQIVDVDISPTYKIMEILREENALPRDNTMICLADMINNLCGGYWKTGGGGAERGIKFAPTLEGRANFIRAVQIINEKAKKEGWPEVAFEVGGEYTNFGKQGAEFAVAVHQAFKEAGVSNTTRGNGPSDWAAVKEKLVDYPQPNWAMLRKDWLDFMKANSKRLWAYNCSTSRFGYGWFCFKHGITRISYEAGIYFQRQPGNVFDDYWGDFPFGGLPTSLTSFAPTVRLRRAVAGAIDLKYLHTLDGLIKKALAIENAREPGRAAAAWLEERLKSLSDGVDDPSGDPRWYGEMNPGPGWFPGDYDKFRWQAAEHIMALQKALNTIQ